MKKFLLFLVVLILAVLAALKFELVPAKYTSLVMSKVPPAVLSKVPPVVLAQLHLGPDSTAKPHTGKSPRLVAQNVTPKTNGAEKVVGPLAPAQSNPSAVTPSGPLGGGPIQAARNAANAQNAQLAKETGQAVPTTVTPAPTAHPTAPPPPAAVPKSTQSPESNQSTPTVVQQGTAKPAAPGAAKSALDAPVMRETFDYTRETRRDPFVSLMSTSDLRPTLSDLHLTGILYDLSGRRPVAILRDIAGGQWRVTTGMTLGRMRVAQIKPKTIIFTIEEFGFNRQDSLFLGDTTRVRHR